MNLGPDQQAYLWGYVSQQRQDTDKWYDFSITYLMTQAKMKQPRDGTWKERKQKNTHG